MIIVTRKSWKKTAKQLGKPFVLQGGTRYNTIPQDEPRLAWGVVDETATWNKAEAVKLCSNKERALIKLQEEGIQNLKCKRYRYASEIEFDPPYIYREKPYGWGGKGITIYYNKVALPTQGFVIQYIEKVEEYRVIIAFNKVLSISRKVGDKDKYKIWNHKNGFKFIRLNWNENRHIGMFAIKVAKTLNIDIAGIDIIEDGNGTLYAIDINTAPGLEGINLEKMKYILDLAANNKLEEVEKINFISMERVNGNSPSS